MAFIHKQKNQLLCFLGLRGRLQSSGQANEGCREAIASESWFIRQGGIPCRVWADAPSRSSNDDQGVIIELAAAIFVWHRFKVIGVCFTKKPWLLVVEYMPYKDLGALLRTCKKHSIKLRTHEFLNFATQVSEAFIYLAEVGWDTTWKSPWGIYLHYCVASPLHTYSLLASFFRKI